MKNKVSLCMIVKDEEKYLGKCLNSVKDIVDEIIILDTGSKDKTVEIAKSFGAKIYYYKWNNNFSEARNKSLKYATKDWILIMDGDDEFCSEDKGKFKQLINSDLNESAIYYFQTLNYCGDFADSSNISVNLNPRLFKNGHGFHYEGQVHNQLINKEYPANNISCPIRIYHYGYLNSSIKDKDKRNRNIKLIKEQIKNNPEDEYAFFNLANEYFALGNIEDALSCYYRSYEKFSLSTGYAFVLLERIVVSNYMLKEYDKALEFADLGINYYKEATDLYYLKGLIYRSMNRPTLEIKAFKKCIELGEAPVEIQFLYGTGSFKALYELGNTYMRLKDYKTAFDYFNKTIAKKSNAVEAVYNIAHILKEEKAKLEDMKKLLESFFSDYPTAYEFIADIFYHEGYYTAALEYEQKLERAGIDNDNLEIFKANCFVRIGKFDECLKMSSIDKDSPIYVKFLMCKLISYILKKEYDEAESLTKQISEIKLQDNYIKVLRVYKELISIMKKAPTKVLSEDEKELGYTNIILEICEIMLVNKKFDEFEMTLELLNLISDKNVLNVLGKLYYKYGYKEMSKRELLRSIKYFDVYDSEGLDILMTP